VLPNSSATRGLAARASGPRIAELTNITIAIVIRLSEIAHRLAGTTKGWFLEFRLIPVLLWSYTSVALGTAMAFAERRVFDPGFLAVAMGLAALIQGWVTHAVNEIYDWRSGTDRHGRLRALSGGSKVRNLGLLDERGLWIVFAASTASVVVLAGYVATARAAWLVLLIGAGYFLGVAYTAPPFATAYRPFVGEGLGAFPGVLLAGLGAYAIQTLDLSWTALAVLSAHAFICTAMLVMHHYVDAPSDAEAIPPKKTTVVFLGTRRARGYATALAAAGAFVYGGLALFLDPVFALGTFFTLPAIAAHARVMPENLLSVTRQELRVIQLGIAAGLSVSVALAPALWLLLPLAAAGYFAHLVVAAPPASLARAWRSVPRSPPSENGPPP